MAIYMSRKDKLDRKGDHNVVMLFLSMIKPRILIDFLFYKATDCLLFISLPLSLGACWECWGA